MTIAFGDDLSLCNSLHPVTTTAGNVHFLILSIAYQSRWWLGDAMADAPDPYCFVVEEKRSGESFVLDIRPKDDTMREHFVKVWQKLGSAFNAQCQLGRTASPGWVNWKPGEWCEQKKDCEDRLQYGAWCGDNLVGFLNVRPHFLSPHATGELLYVEHLAAAPGNIDTSLWSKRFQYTGQALLAYAVLLSKNNGYSGRFGLHVADAAALEWYRHLNKTKCGGSLFFPERSGVNGPGQHGDRDAEKTFLEATEPGAAAWLETYRSA